jgi:hypothetical protein
MPRKQLSLLLQQCRFKEAEEVQRIVERMDAQERESGRKLMQHDYMESVRKLAEKHDSEFAVFEQNANTRLAQLALRRQTERLSFVNKQKRIEKREEETRDANKVWAAAGSWRNQTTSRCETQARSGTASAVTRYYEERVSTSIELPPLKMIKPARRHCVSHSARI